VRTATHAAALLSGVFSLLLASPLARAEEGGDEPAPLAAPGGYEDVPPAVRHYQRAQELYEEGRYQEAAAELEEARTLDPDAPELLYNLALVYERLNEFDRAIGHLEHYLTFDLAPDERVRIERMMSRLQGAREHMPEQPEPETRTRVRVHRYGLADAWFWGILGTGLALGATAVGTGVAALMYGQEADLFVAGQDGGPDEYRWLVDTSTGLALATDVLIGVAGAAAATAILLYALRQRPVEEREDGEPRTLPSDDWGPPPSGLGGTDAGEEEGEGTGSPPPSGDDDGDGWGPPPPGTSARSGGGDASRRGRARPPIVALGLGAAMIGWEL
jgi:tetratricopeptide (TPR) repeat protein